MKAIALASLKGGVGKSTLAAALAVRAVQDGLRVALVDLDPQESVADWFGRRADKAGLTLFHNADLASEAMEALGLTEAPDLVIFDTPPAFVPTVADAIATADLSVIPLRPGALDLIGSEGAVQLAAEAGRPYLCVFNDADARWKGLASAREYLQGAGVPIAGAVVAHRSAFMAAMASGKTGAEGSDKRAAEEIDALWSEIKAALEKGGSR
ncbi:ParA family protein [Hyphomicrobium sulfonivorans]|uniref:ParA family protein n=1 Tax=Hyphomicrobium sulfonivorans TaxID=121290 RepID=UPI0015712394|nr:ParA family protein [Hyphomicrobium sulfonivorans]MBI1650135.1 ParA family protein [Hyphomicrobium sulfonivorans]NSL73050.1 hypothetical protein [Hyphomicrobium sulfonivorans]